MSDVRTLIVIAPEGESVDPFWIAEQIRERYRVKMSRVGNVFEADDHVPVDDGAPPAPPFEGVLEHIGPHVNDAYHAQLWRHIRDEVHRLDVRSDGHTAKMAPDDTLQVLLRLVRRAATPPNPEEQAELTALPVTEEEQAALIEALDAEVASLPPELWVIPGVPMGMRAENIAAAGIPLMIQRATTDEVLAYLKRAME